MRHMGCLLKLKINFYYSKIHVTWKNFNSGKLEAIKHPAAGDMIHVLEYNAPFENIFKELLITGNFSWHSDRWRKPVPDLQLGLQISDVCIETR